MVVTVGATRTPRPLRNRVHEQVSRSTPMVSLRSLSHGTVQFAPGDAGHSRRGWTDGSCRVAPSIGMGTSARAAAPRLDSKARLSHSPSFASSLAHFRCVDACRTTMCVPTA
jgi:hypothetical protein